MGSSIKRSREFIPRDAQSWALVAILAALHIVLSVIPIFPFVTPFGAGSIAAAAITVPLFGILLGPILGPIAALIGGIIGSFLNPGASALFLGFGFLPGVVGALVAGLLAQKRLYPFSAYLATVIYAVLVLGFLFFPPNKPFISFLIFLWFHLIILCALAVTVLLPPIRKRVLESEIPWVRVFFIALCGTMSDQMTGSFFFQAVSAPIIFGGYLPAEIWLIIAVLYPIERIIITIAATIIGVVVIRALKDIGFAIAQ